MVKPSSTIIACDDNNNKLNLKRSPWKAKQVEISSNISSHHPHKKSPGRDNNNNKRCGRNSRMKWSDLSSKHEKISFNEKEDELIIRLHSAIGSRWAIIAQQIPGRTDNDVKNHWNAKLKKKLTDMGVDPVTHKPFSQLAIDYRNIGCGGKGDYEPPTQTECPSSASSTYYYKQDLKKKNKSKSAFFAGRTITEPFAEGNPNPSNRQLFMEATVTLPSSTKESPAAVRYRDRDQITRTGAARPQFFSSAGNNAISSFDLLYQLQAATRVSKDHPCVNPAASSHGNDDDDDRRLLLPSCGQLPYPISSFPSSDSERLGAEAAVFPEPFSWRDFLLDEEINMMQEGDQVDNNGTMKGCAGSCGLHQDEEAEIEESGSHEAVSAGIEVEEEAVDLESSFVDQLLGKEKELLLLDDFLGVLEEDSL